MIDPYGDDYDDLSVITFVSSCLDISRICLSARDQDPVDEEFEKKLLRRHNEIANSPLLTMASS